MGDDAADNGISLVDAVWPVRHDVAAITVDPGLSGHLAFSGKLQFDRVARLHGPPMVPPTLPGSNSVSTSVP